VSLRLRQLKLEVVTDAGMYGCSIPFGDGLVVLRAENTTGKSTCIKSIVYALGLERMFGPGSEPPLPPAMRSLLEDGDREHRVIESSVFLEVENHHGKRVTFGRQVAGAGERDWRLITVWDGPALSRPGHSYVARDYYVRDPGSASREDGFHVFLAEFIGWRLPQVAKFTGDEVPLYMECMLPLFYIEQMNGWSRIQATTPRFFQIRETEKRAVEFVLNLDVLVVSYERQRIASEEAEIRHAWASALKESEALVAGEGAIIEGLSADPLIVWPPPVPPFLQVPVDDQWISMTEAVERDRQSLKHLETTAIPTAAQVTNEIAQELGRVSTEVAKLEQFAKSVRELIEIDSSELISIDMRLDALAEDLAKNQDVVKLRQYGSPSASISAGYCPTCRQPVSDSLLPQEPSQSVMTVEDNIAFITSQRRTFEKMRGNVERVLMAKRKQLQAAQGRLVELRSEYRSLRQTLQDDGRAPSLAAVRERVLLAERIERRDAAQERFTARLAYFAELSDRWLHLAERKAAARGTGLSGQDHAKLNRVEALVIDQETEYGFKSFPPNLIKLSHEDYHPTRAGFDLVYDVSASDNVRTIAAYVISLLEIAREPQFTNNHLGLLIMDEPRQQSLRLSSFREVFSRVSMAAKFGQQVLVATSESKESIDSILSGLNAPNIHYHNFDTYILAPQSGSKRAEQEFSS
jgi:hypothetical protein